jgi:hypothetical protein
MVVISLTPTLARDPESELFHEELRRWFYRYMVPVCDRVHDAVGWGAVDR